MKKIISICLLFLITTVAFGQTAAQLSAMQNLTPQQIEALKKNQSQLLKQTDNKKSSKKLTDLEVEKKYREEIIIDEDINKTIYDSIEKSKLERENSIFGHEIFSRQNLTFAPSMNLPTPENYVLGSGDELNINIWGASEADYKTEVTPDGYVNIENVGLVMVKGLTMREADKKIKSQLVNKFESIADGAANINISLGKIRSITVNVAGEAKVPGTYTLPSLATLFNALYVAGGVSEIGSVREINMYRNGKKVTSLDVYEYLFNGKTESNVRLQDNDLIVVEPYINVAKVAGSIKRPMRYELKSNENISSLLKYAGGFNGEAVKNNVAVTRSANGKQLEMFTVDKAGYDYFLMADKDSVFISKVSEKYANRVSVSGEVWQPGNFEIKPEIATIKQLLKQAGGTTKQAFLGRALLHRLNDDGKREVIGVNIQDILDGKKEDVKLNPNDSLAVYSYEYFNPKEFVVVVGEVNVPDTLTYGAGMTLRDAIVACGGFQFSASHAKLEISRRVTDRNATTTPDKVAEIYSFKINGDLSINSNIEEFKLMPFDEIFIRKSPGYLEQMNIVIEGEVVFDGEYTLHNRVTKLTDIIERSGGLTKDAYAKGAYLRRLKTEFDLEREESLKKIQETSNKNDTLVLKLNEVYYSVAIDLVAALNDPNSMANLELKSGDKIVIPTLNNTVKISGAVYYPNTVTFDPSGSVKDYIEKAGGYSDRARRKPFIIYQNGMVAKKGKIIEPGSEIVVPFKPMREPMGVSGWISLSSSVISMATMITSLLR